MWAYKTIKSLLDQNTVSENDTLKEKAKELALKVCKTIAFSHF